MSFHKGEYIWNNQVEIYNIKNRTWAKGAAMPIKLANATAFVIDNEIHLIGGTDKYGNNSQGLKETYFVYNTANNLWKEKEKLPFKIQSAEGAFLNGKFFLFGGLYDFPNPSKEVKSLKLK